MNQEHHDDPIRPTLAEQKAALEIEKLKAEIRAANRSQWLSPATLISTVVALVAVGGFFIQRAVMNVDLKQAQLDLAESRNEKKHLDEEKDDLKKQLESKKSELEKSTQELAEVRRQFNGTVISVGKFVPLGQDITIDGMVLDADGKPLANAEITVFRVPSKYTPAVSKMFSPNADGSFTCAIPSGPPFILLIHANGRQEVAFSNMAGDSDQRFRIVMTPPQF